MLPSDARRKGAGRDHRGPAEGKRRESRDPLHAATHRGGTKRGGCSNQYAGDGGSNTGKGNQFQLKCKAAFQNLLGRPMEEEVSMPALGGKPHKFDLATHERDVVVECKAFTWTSGGNVPSAKITTLREAVQYLRSIPATSVPYLVISKASLREKTETLGQYFVRLNEDMLGNVNVLEMPPEGGELGCLYGQLPNLLRVARVVRLRTIRSNSHRSSPCLPNPGISEAHRLQCHCSSRRMHPPRTNTPWLGNTGLAGRP